MGTALISEDYARFFNRAIIIEIDFKSVHSQSYNVRTS